MRWVAINGIYGIKMLVIKKEDANKTNLLFLSIIIPPMWFPTAAPSRIMPITDVHV